MNIKQRIIELFNKISQFPHVSGHTEQLTSYLTHFAETNHVQSENIDGNLIITIPASPGYEDKKPIIIQGHSDMVGAKTSELDFDFLKDHLEILVSTDQKYMKANQTTLGGDDGIALVFMMLLIQERKNFNHPKIYCVITKDEEIGLLGAKALKVDSISDSEFLINLDTEAEGILINGSSGGEQVEASYHFDTNLALGTVYEVSIAELTGGHSGGNTLAQNGAQASKILAQILGHLFQLYHVQLLSFDCPGLNNLVTSEGKATFISNAPQKTLVEETIQYLKLIAACYLPTDPKLTLNLKVKNEPDKLRAFTVQSTGNIIFTISNLPYGVTYGSGLNPISSVNIGSCIAHDNRLTIREHFRFSNQNWYSLQKNKLIQYFTFTGAQIRFDKLDPPWIPNENSKLVQLAQNTWEELGYQPLKINTMHATLETGIFKEKLPNIDIISIGPTIENIHTPNERLDLDSAVRLYKFLIKLLEKTVNV